MHSVNIHEAKTQLSRLLARVEKGEEITICKAGKPIAKLTAVAPLPKRQPAPFGFAKGSVLYMSDDFDAPMPDFEDAFYNAPLSSSEPPERPE